MLILPEIAFWSKWEHWNQFQMTTGQRTKGGTAGPLTIHDWSFGHNKESPIMQHRNVNWVYWCMSRSLNWSWSKWLHLALLCLKVLLSEFGQYYQFRNILSLQTGAIHYSWRRFAICLTNSVSLRFQSLLSEGVYCRSVYIKSSFGATLDN
jgi:hypothetical protein